MKEAIKYIGNTPIYHIENTNIFVKLERFNLGGSVKDRAVLGMLLAAQKANMINENTVLIEASSGNTGISLAMLGAIYGYKVVIIMPESMSKERREIIKAYGAQLILTPKEGGMKQAIALAEEYIANNENCISLSQFENIENPKYHYRTTAEEILKAVPNIDIFVAGIGTGGTFTGVVENLKEHKNIYAIAVEPTTSPYISEHKAGPHKIQGIGAGFIPKNFNETLMDEVMTISDEEAFSETKNFIRSTGISIGISAGAAIAAAKKVAETHPDKTIVTVAPDGVEKYLSMLEFDEVKYI